MTDINTGLGLLTSVFNNTHIFGSGLILPIVTIVFTMMLISRNTAKWFVLPLPITIGWMYSGLYVSFVVLISEAMMFVIASLSFNIIGNIISGTGKSFKDSFKSISKSISGYKSPEEKFDSFKKSEYIRSVMKRRRREEKEKIAEFKAKQLEQAMLHASGLKEIEKIKAGIEKKRIGRNITKFKKKQAKLKRAVIGDLLRY